MPPKLKPSSTARGLGWAHQQDRARLIRAHTDGTLCWWCALPMYSDRAYTRNWDCTKLAADHSIARAIGGTKADRLLHSKCNSQRGDGSRDRIRPAAIGCHPTEWVTTITTQGLATVPAPTAPQLLAMDW